MKQLKTTVERIRCGFGVLFHALSHMRDQFNAFRQRAVCLQGLRFSWQTICQHGCVTVRGRGLAVSTRRENGIQRPAISNYWCEVIHMHANSKVGRGAVGGISIRTESHAVLW